MPNQHRVIWTEGMFLRPQHFQQHDRYLETLINSRARGLIAFDWGFSSLEIDRGQLAFGKFVVTACQGIFPDGTPFNMPAEDNLPLPIDIGDGIRDQIIFLCLPLRTPDLSEFDDRENSKPLARYQTDELELRDATFLSGPEAPIEVGKLHTRLLLEKTERGGYVCLPVARILEVSATHALELDKEFIPTAINCLNTGLLGSFLSEINGILKSRAESLAAVITGVERMIAAEASHLLALQVINRFQPLLSHHELTGKLHPENFFQILLQLAGELSTFYRKPDRRPINFPAYRHDDLRASFIPLIDEIRQLLLVEVERHAFQIPLEIKKAGAAYLARRPDPIMLETATLVLAAKAELPADNLIIHLPNQIKIAPVEEIQHLINQALPGLVVKALPHVPQHIPRHAGFCYFEIEKHSPLWKRMRDSVGFAIHIGGEFPGLELELWATTLS